MGGSERRMQGDTGVDCVCGGRMLVKSFDRVPREVQCPRCGRRPVDLLATPRDPVYVPPPELLRTGEVGAFVGIPVYRSFDVERGRYMVAWIDYRRRTGECVFEGAGLLRGVAYRGPGVQRGYLLPPNGEWVNLLDAVTGWIVRVRADDCTEIEARYRQPTIAEAITS